MEYTLKMTISPTVHEGSLAVRMFINAKDRDGHSETAQIWECSVPHIKAESDTDPLTWASSHLLPAAEKLCTAAMATYVEGQSKTMSDLFQPHLF